LVLKLLARRGPLHGYGIATKIEGMSDEVLRVEEGAPLRR
jgi:DNA-binding PadR family transcriptional regulator